MKKQTIALIGATGSVGKQSIDLIEHFTHNFDLTLLSCHSNWKDLSILASPWPKAQLACTAFDAGCPPDHFLIGTDAIIQAIQQRPPDILLIASSGLTAFSILRDCYSYCSRIAIANKETLILAGCSGLLPQIQQHCILMPIDSEHASIHRLLQGCSADDLRKIYLTASGGPFYSSPNPDFDWDSITPEQALRHPTWNMGPKISLDSATMANKGIELLEAHFLFSLTPDKLDILIHPHSLVHAVAEWVDGTSSAHIAPADMRLCIQYALSWPKLFSTDYTEALDWKKLSILPFVPFEAKGLPIIQSAYECISNPELAKWLPLAYLAADEIVLDRFIHQRIAFKDIGVWMLDTLRDVKKNYYLDTKSINPSTILGIYKVMCDWIKKGY
jgi:1-deoxy-D-xylulose-5-phosphate reductoisomerase